MNALTQKLRFRQSVVLFLRTLLFNPFVEKIYIRIIFFYYQERIIVLKKNLSVAKNRRIFKTV